MTDIEWDLCTESQEMLQFLQEPGRVSDRKLRLAAGLDRMCEAAGC